MAYGLKEYILDCGFDEYENILYGCSVRLLNKITGEVLDLEEYDQFTIEIPGSSQWGGNWAIYVLSSPSWPEYSSSYESFDTDTWLITADVAYPIYVFIAADRKFVVPDNITGEPYSYDTDYYELVLGENEIEVEMTQQLSAPTNLAASNIKATDAVVSWTAVENATSYKVEYRRQGDTTWNE